MRPPPPPKDSPFSFLIQNHQTVPGKDSIIFLVDCTTPMFTRHDSAGSDASFIEKTLGVCDASSHPTQPPNPPRSPALNALNALRLAKGVGAASRPRCQPWPAGCRRWSTVAHRMIRPCHCVYCATPSDACCPPPPKRLRTIYIFYSRRRPPMPRLSSRCCMRS